VDILIEPSRENIRKMLDVLINWGEGFAAELAIEDFPVSPGAVRIIEDFPLDIFTILSGKTYNDFWPSAKRNPQGIAYLDPESLIKTKKNTRREKDNIDILALRKILKEKKHSED